MTTAAVHLVRAANGVEAFESFLASYEALDAGAAHDLVLLFKGFVDDGETRPYLERAGAMRPRSLHVPDDGFDITAYREAARALNHERVCFLNSFSVIAAPNWLRHLEVALDHPGIGAAGATGSWGSQLSYHLYQASASGSYARAFSSRRQARDALHTLSNTSGHGALAEMAYAAVQALRTATTMPLFPAVHLRTNAFLIERQRFADLEFGAIKTKRGAYRFESGRRSLTAQLHGQGLETVVVNRHGAVFDERRWDRAGVFWQGEQQDVLVEDNQTRAFATADPRVRAVLSAFAWGERSTPVALPVT